MFKAGDRIRLIEMPQEPDPIEPGSTGTVISDTDFGSIRQVIVTWDSGRSLCLAIPPDRAVKIEEGE